MSISTNVKEQFIGNWPVDDSTHVDLQVAEGSQLLLLHHDQVHVLVVQSQETHAALEDVEGVSAFLPFVFSRTAWTEHQSEKTPLSLMYQYATNTNLNMERHTSSR